MTSVAMKLVGKDIYLNRWLIGVALIGGLISVVVLGLSHTGFNFGSVLYLTTIIAYGVVLVMHSVVQERKDKSLVFVLSLPLAPADYMRAKVLSVLGTFLVPWFVLSLASLGTIWLTPTPDGLIPFFIAISALMLMNFCLVLATALVTPSEPVVTLIIIVTNASISLFFMFMSTNTAVNEANKTDAIVWVPLIVEVIVCELAVAALALAVPFIVRGKRGPMLRS